MMNTKVNFSDVAVTVVLLSCPTGDLT